jgi:hypothetical protein
MPKPPRNTRKARRGETDKPTAVEPPRPSVDEIRRRAYEIYTERGRTPGQELDDWLRAERELRRQPT